MKRIAIGASAAFAAFAAFVASGGWGCAVGRGACANAGRDSAGGDAGRASVAASVGVGESGPALAFASRTVELSTDFGTESSEDVRLTGTRSNEVELAIRSVECVDPLHPEVRVLPRGLRLTVRGERVGRGAGQVVVATGLKDPETLTVLFSWNVRGNVTVEPTNPFIDRRAPPASETVVHVTSRRPDFRLSGAVVTGGPFTAAIEGEGGPTAYAVRVRVDEVHAPAGERGLVGRLRLESNDPAEPLKEIPLFALGEGRAAL